MRDRWRQESATRGRIGRLLVIAGMQTLDPGVSCSVTRSPSHRKVSDVVPIGSLVLIDVERVGSPSGH
jgi:hypothetical protein